MEIDNEYPDYKSQDNNEIFIRQTLLSSPLITNIIPNFKVQTNKPFKGVTSNLFNDEEFQVLIPREEPDSQLDAFSDSEEDLILHGEDDIPMATQQTRQQQTNIQHVQVIIRHSSLLIDGIEFSAKTEIRSSCVIKGATDEEDLLFISLKSNYLLLIRLYYVPRHYKDDDYHFQSLSHVKDEGNSIFKPFVIQWWETSSFNNSPDSCSGYMLRSSPSGLSTVSCSSSNSFRLYLTSHSKNGTMLKNHVNIETQGTLLDACFIQLDSPTDMFMTLIFTEQRRLIINLFSWLNYEGLTQSFSKSTLPLDNTFEIPVFVIPLKNNGSFLFVSQTKFTIVTIHDIISAEYSFNSIATKWESCFPTSFYVPEIKITLFELDKLDEVLISTDSGVIFSIVIADNKFIAQDPIARVSDNISVFSLEPETNHTYRLIFASDNGSSKEVVLSGTFTKEYLYEVNNLSKIGYSNFKLIKDFKNWAPLMDIAIIETYNRPRNSQLPSRQEIWGISGTPKKSKLSQFRHGYSATKITGTFEKLRKADKLFVFTYNEVPYLLCSLPFESILLETPQHDNDAFAEISNPIITIQEQTIFATDIITSSGSVILQVCPSHMRITNLIDTYSTKQFPYRVFECGFHGGLLIMLAETTNNIIQCVIWKLESDIDRTFESLEPILVKPIPHEPSAMKLLSAENNTYIIIGTFEGQLVTYCLQGGDIQEVYNFQLSDICPYNPMDIISLELIIPNDFHIVNNSLFIGTKEGYLIRLEMNHKFSLTQFLRIGESNVKFCPSGDNNFLFIQCKGLWLLNQYESVYPKLVHFDDTFERTISASVELSSSDTNKRKLVLVRDNGLVLTKVSTFTESAIKQISITENAKKLIYVAHISMFLVLCKSKSSKNRIRCVDRKSVRIMTHRESTLKSKNTEDQIFAKNEFPVCGCVWEVVRGKSKISRKILVGCSITAETGNEHGSVKVLDFKKAKLQDGSTIMSVVELTTFEHDSPITNIQQSEQLILFTSGKNIYYTGYDENEKRFTPVKLLEVLPSTIVSLNISNDKLFIATRFDSIYQFKAPKSGMPISYVAGDPLPNHFINQIEYKSKIIASDKLYGAVSIIDVNDKKYSAERMSYKLSNIPRVYLANLNNNWNQDNTCTILCIGINGEIISLRSVPKKGKELTELNNRLRQDSTSIVTWEKVIEKLSIPFANKVGGTGLFSLNKPIFDYNENRGKFIDYDLLDISTISTSKISL
ncbi:uncharacterized protein SPAPADRAFT_71869 [Spathaspora passalidarum NRRL Y-27907]|uniref:Uncharacterized protein n=1 Tax=Spathaspora passalidarum (strain NRRL Y-27907 / 11-Y1) TaxID=619300 RepID=G3AN44_SPAPN|nr:uncharacterized protein SPAPADRAFT_71869 [Spathaspora passalidarum NRRL Y-27907]EGW32458.1 hypothetical protein SPAPADRAFT_71869 [Spathaspora passalidarum NRRL Y-27907]